MNDFLTLELAGVACELKDLGDLEAEIALFPDGQYEVISEKAGEMTYLTSLAYLYIYTGNGLDPNLEENKEIFYKTIIHRPVIDKIAETVHKITLPKDGEIKIIPVLYLLGGKVQD